MEWQKLPEFQNLFNAYFAILLTVVLECVMPDDIFINGFAT